MNAPPIDDTFKEYSVGSTLSSYDTAIDLIGENFISLPFQAVPQVFPFVVTLRDLPLVLSSAAKVHYTEACVVAWWNLFRHCQRGRFFTLSFYKWGGRHCSMVCVMDSSDVYSWPNSRRHSIRRFLHLLLLLLLFFWQVVDIHFGPWVDELYRIWQQ